MAVYAKPIITNSATRGLIPALILSPVPFVSPVAPIVAGAVAVAAALLAGLVAGRLATKAVEARPAFRLPSLTEGRKENDFSMA